jgi:hypothetical protein
MNPRNPFSEQFEMARLIGFLSMAEQTLEIADDSTNDWMEREGRRGVKVRVLDYEHVERSKLKIETRKWLLSKMLPKLFGRHLPAQPEGQEPKRDSAFLQILRNMHNGLMHLSEWASRLENGQRPQQIKHAIDDRLITITANELICLYNELGAPKPETAIGAVFAKMFKRERMLERYDELQTAYLEAEPPVQPAINKPQATETKGLQ